MKVLVINQTFDDLLIKIYDTKKLVIPDGLVIVEIKGLTDSEKEVVVEVSKKEE